MKKFIVIIGILLVIFIGLYIYKRQDIKTHNVTAEEVSKIEEYISKVYMWKEVTGDALPIFNSINEAPEKWIWEVVKKNIDDYENITYDQINQKAKEIFGEDFSKTIPKEGNESFIYNQESNIYEVTNIELDSDSDAFFLNKIEKKQNGYQVEIIEYIEDYSEEQVNLEEEEQQEFNINIKNTKGEKIISIKNTEGQTKVIEQVKNNIDKFTKKNIELIGDLQTNLVISNISEIKN